jgi:hypothetical protein
MIFLVGITNRNIEPFFIIKPKSKSSAMIGNELSISCDIGGFPHPHGW